MASNNKPKYANPKKLTAAEETNLMKKSLHVYKEHFENYKIHFEIDSYFTSQNNNSQNNNSQNIENQQISNFLESVLYKTHELMDIYIKTFRNHIEKLRKTLKPTSIGDAPGLHKYNVPKNSNNKVRKNNNTNVTKNSNNKVSNLFVLKSQYNGSNTKKNTSNPVIKQVLDNIYIPAIKRVLDGHLLVYNSMKTEYLEKGQNQEVRVIPMNKNASLKQAESWLMSMFNTNKSPAIREKYRLNLLKLAAEFVVGGARVAGYTGVPGKGVNPGQGSPGPNQTLRNQFLSKP